MLSYFSCPLHMPSQDLCIPLPSHHTLRSSTTTTSPPISINVTGRGSCQPTAAQSPTHSTVNDMQHSQRYAAQSTICSAVNDMQRSHRYCVTTPSRLATASRRMSIHHNTVVDIDHHAKTDTSTVRPACDLLRSYTHSS